ncbi:MAG TPA: HNH endonuclease [Armatimonadota bacterium]|nr:HNH endonuclease [Armatimonadota bacterium]
MEERARGLCEYCRTPAAFSAQPFEADHILPSVKGGPTVLNNLAYSCGCNRYKSDRTHAPDPLTGRSVELFHPRQHVWKRHFRWSEDGTLILGRTAIGRSTVELLRMNRLALVNLRRLLILAGKHPPAEE